MRSVLITGMILLTLISAGCIEDGDEEGYSPSRDYRQDMRNLVININQYSKNTEPDFLIIPQNGQELLTLNGEPTGPPAKDYIKAIDGVGREDLFYGYEKDDRPTPESERDYMISLLDLALSQGLEVLVTDYCSTPSRMDDSYNKNSQKGYLSFSADHRDLDDIPSYPGDPFNMNSDNITSLSDARNFLYILDPEGFPSKTEYLNALGNTNFDIILMDLFYEDEVLSSMEVDSLKTKENGGERLVIAYMSIGEAEDYRFYWESEWKKEKPSWLEKENPDWEGNYKVRYWERDWQNIIFGNKDSYLDMILNSGFDGVYLDIIDAFEYFE
jgi:cysteinyl-tRNA synthetase